MSRRFDTTILDAEVAFEEQPFVVPLQLSTGIIAEITEARVRVAVRVDGKEATGAGSIYLSDLWAWPEPSLTHAQRDAQLRAYTAQIAKTLSDFCGDEAAHPLKLGLRLHDTLSADAGETLPLLARAMCASPFDAAIHDAVGYALGISAFDFYEEPVEFQEADLYFESGSARSAILRALKRPPSNALDAWVIVNKNDGIDNLRPWVAGRGIRCFKLKIMGKDADADVARTADVYRMVTSLGVERPRLTVDSNEANPGASSVLEYLEKLRAKDLPAFDALEYLEQPTARDIRESPQDWREVARLKPVLLDEGLTSLELLEESLEQHWSGFALKTCKGHSFALTAAAWAVERGLLIAMQDLTNPGVSAIHSALLAAHLPVVNGVELNSPQFTPAANAAWLPRLDVLFEPRDGMHHLPDHMPPGLGSRL